MASDLTELHSHLYGCLVEDDLAWLASRRPPKLEYFASSYKAHYGVSPDLSGLFLAQNRTRLSDYLHFAKPDSFAAFQVCFDLIISCAHTDPEELYNVAIRVREREPATYAEYRMLFGPTRGETEFIEGLCALTEAFASHGRCTSKLVISINRRGQRGTLEYEWIRRFQRSYPKLAPFVSGVDFCAQEEGFPPKEKIPLFDSILSDNEAPENQSLDILYHVGESFEDKSVESAARWVVQSAEMGAHRLGHAIALGVPPSVYAGTVRHELAAERLDQIDFEIANADELESFGVRVDVEALRMEAQSLREPTDPDGAVDTVAIEYDPLRLARLEKFQEFAMERVRRTGAIVESCPTSNLRIARLGTPDRHPLRRFLAAGLEVVIGADDPGILDSSLDKELEMVSSWDGVGDAAVEAMNRRAYALRRA